MEDTHVVYSIWTLHISACVLLLLLTAPMCRNHMPYLVAIASFKDLATVAQEKSSSQTADVLVQEKLQPPIGLCNSIPGARTA